MRYKLLYFALFLWTCTSVPDKLPILGDRIIEQDDTSYHTIAPFKYLDQDSNLITNATFKDKAYVADFFFTSCPTICPKVTRQMLRLQEAFQKDNRLQFLSYSIDYRKDSVPILKRYADKVGINGARWHLVQLKKDEVERVANQYFSIAYEDETVAGGFDHSGRLMLVDKNGHIRAYCDGTDEQAVDEFMLKIHQLLDEEG